MEIVLGAGVVIAVLFVAFNIKMRDWGNLWFWAIVACLLLVFLGK